MRNKQTIRVYEEYATAKDKHKAQRGATRAQPTGKAKSFVFVYPSTDGKMWGVGCLSLYENLPEVVDPNTVYSMADSEIAWQFLHQQCRRIGKKYLPPAWAKYLKHLESEE
jgi:hypothetical protein